MKESGTGTFPGSRGFSIYYRYWNPEVQARAAIILVHGYADHSGRHAGLAGVCRAAGFTVYAMDFRGHGKSDGTPGDIEDFDLCASDIMTLLRLVKDREKDKKVFLLGHSLGGSISCLFASEHQDDIDGLIVCSSLVYMSQDVPKILK